MKRGGPPVPPGPMPGAPPPIDPVPDFTIPFILSRTNWKEAFTWFASGDTKKRVAQPNPHERFRSGSPYYSAGIFGRLLPEDVKHCSQEFYSKIPLQMGPKVKTASLDDVLCYFEGEKKNNFVLDHYFSAVTSMRHDEVRFLYFPTGEELKQLVAEEFTESAYARDGSAQYVMLATISARRKNNVPEIAKYAKQLNANERFFRILRIPLNPTSLPTEPPQQPQIEAPIISFSGVITPVDVFSQILSHLSWNDIFSLIQVSKSFNLFFNFSEFSDKIWKELGLIFLDGHEIPTEKV